MKRTPTPTPLHEPVLLLEALEGSRFRVRVIAAGTSKNGNHYPEAVLREAAPMFAGVRVFAKADDEHLAGKGRSIRNLIGRLVEPRFVEAADGQPGQIQAVFELLESAGEIAGKVREAHSRGMADDLFGFSIDAHGETRRRLTGKREVERFIKVNSLDLIIEPSAGGALLGLVEATDDQPEDPPDMGIKQRMIEAIKAANGGALPDGLDPENEDALVEAYSAAVTNTTTLSGAGKDGSPAADKDVRLAEALDARLALIEARAELRLHLAEADLPAVSKERLRQRLSARGDLTLGLIEAEVQAERDYLAKLTEAGKPTGMGGRVEAGESGSEKLRQMFDDLFDPTKRHRSIREAYIQLTGDVHISGHLRECDARRLREAAELLPEHLRESISSSTFSNILGDSITRRMLADYTTPDAVLDWWRGVVSVTPIADFRTNERVRMGGYGSLPTVAQGQPYLALTSPGDEHESYAVGKKGGTEDLTLEMVRNDDMGVVQRIPVKLARAARRTLSEFVAAFFSSNPAMSDTKAWFHADHSNLGSTALDATALAATRLLVMKHGELTSGKRLGIPPRNLLVPLDLEETAFNLFRQTTNNQADFVEAMQMRVIPVWAWTDASDWYVTVDPMEIPFLEIGFLDGREEPDLFVQDSPTAGSLFTHDKVTYKVRHIYGGAPTDYRGVYKHAVT